MCVVKQAGIVSCGEKRCWYMLCKEPCDNKLLFVRMSDKKIRCGV